MSDQPQSPTNTLLLKEIEHVVRRVVREELQATPSHKPGLLDVAGVAQRLGVSERTVETLAQMGELPFTRIGTRGRGARRFEPEAVEAFIRRRASST